jgi:hypothetical protein
MPDDDKKEDKDASREALEKDAASEDPKKAARAKRALAAYDEKDDAKAADESPDKKDDDKKDDDKSAKALAVVSAQLSAVTASLAKAEAKQALLDKAEADAKAIADRQALYATRKDLAGETLKALDAMSLEQAKATMALIPVGAIRVNPFAPADVKVTLGSTHASTAAELLASRPNPELDRQLGWIQAERGVVLDGVVLQLGAPLPAKGS